MIWTEIEPGVWSAQEEGYTARGEEVPADLAEQVPAPFFASVVYVSGAMVMMVRFKWGDSLIEAIILAIRSFDAEAEFVPLEVEKERR